MIRGSLSTKKQSYNYYNDFKHKETNAVKLWSHETKKCIYILKCASLTATHEVLTLLFIIENS